MTYLVFSNQADAEEAQNLILRLASLGMLNSGLYDVDPISQHVSSGFRGGQKVPATTDRWSDVLETLAGDFVIAHPGGEAMYTQEMEEAPGNVAFYLFRGDMGAVNAAPWAAIAAAAGVQTTDPTLPQTLTGEKWLKGMFAAKGWAWDEVTDPEFPDEEI